VFAEFRYFGTPEDFQNALEKISKEEVTFLFTRQNIMFNTTHLTGKGEGVRYNE